MRGITFGQVEDMKCVTTELESLQSQLSSSIYMNGLISNITTKMLWKKETYSNDLSTSTHTC